jgi:two-component system response regulator BaeR
MPLLPPHILIVEDDAKIADMVANYLHMHGYCTSVLADGAKAVQTIRSTPPDLVLLDLMLQGLDGVAVCKAVRQFSTLPIIMVTARVDELDRLLGLEVGADDYVCKPFSPRELVARVKALLRRSMPQLQAAKQAHTSTANTAAAEITIDAAQQRIRWRDQHLPLTPVEFRLLSLLISRPNHIFARSRLLDHLHQDFRDVSDRAIDSHIKNLRRKLAQAQMQAYAITSVYGAGYRFEHLPP